MDGEDFKQRVYRAMEDTELSRDEKLVMVAYFLYESNRAKVLVSTGLSRQSLEAIERSLMMKDWLASPEG